MATYIKEGGRRPAAKEGAPFDPPSFQSTEGGKGKGEREKERGGHAPPLVQFALGKGGRAPPPVACLLSSTMAHEAH